MAKFCFNCGAQVQDTSKFCAICGQAQTTQIDTQQHRQEYEQPVNTPIEQTPQPGEHPPEQQIPQQFAPPAQPQYAQQRCPQAEQYQHPYAPAPKKKSKLPLILGIVGGVVVVIVVTVVLLLNGVRAALDKTAKTDYYEIGNDRIPSVKMALDEERKVTGVSTSTENGAEILEITYSSPETDQGEEMSTYLNYLREEDGFLLVTDVDFTKSKSQGGLGRNSVDDGYEILMQIAYDRSGYTITLVRQEGGITPNDTPAPTPVTPAIAAESAFAIIDSGTFHMSIVFVGGDSDGVEMELFKKDGKSAMTLEGQGMSIRRLTMDGKFYTVLDEYETVAVTEINPSEIPPVEYDSSELTYVGEGSGDWNGTVYPYSEYKGVRGEQMFYFMDRATLKGIRSISPTGNTVNSEIRVLDSSVPDNAFEWPAQYTVEDPDAQDAWIGLWRYEGEDGLELIHLKADNTFFVDSHFEGPDGTNQYTGNYGASEGELTLNNVLKNGEPTEDMAIPWLVEGDVLILGGDDDASYYFRVPKEDEAAVLADPLAPYTNPNIKP